ncbi:Mur ligase family protein [Vermiculatibacterium agrestimuris]|uniref:Mur ligase family protein n=1 Tax=Vermiculatibacterium agrestimuris TaxID=2941519 RepID=UPI00204265CB|nr:UDP-N-acetylmuramoyl-L-alanyl-D-glutamate--2,6-diaminopimelate ligase [Vermiculatibacterium agrestimuris]
MTMLERPRLPLGAYYQLLLKKGLLADHTPLSADLTRPVEAVTCDSRSAVPGSLFICKGAHFKPEYLLQALERGAFAYVSETACDDVPAPCIRVTDIRAAMGELADLAWGHPSGALEVIGITGTKGKTTTAYFIKSILDCWRQREGLHSVGLLSTIVTDDGAQRRPAVLTTPEPLDLQRHLWNAANAGCGYVVMECSSQALKYGRMTGVDLAVATFLNIGEDHISPKEHPTLEDYFQSKLKIFDHAKAAVVNLDSDRQGELLDAAEKCEKWSAYSLRFAHGLRRTGEGMSFTVHIGEADESFTLPLTGAFNVSNALCAISVCSMLGAPLWAVRQGLAGARVPGRMETYSAGGKTVIVDYAHNGMALEALLRSVQADYPAAPIALVFGCTGGKGLDRREGMGTAAGKYADAIYLTEDDPGPEEVEAICAEIGSYITPFGKTYTVLPDREEAIRTAIAQTPEGGVVVLAGKGSEMEQKRKNGPEPCVPDALLAKKYLELPLGE